MCLQFEVLQTQPDAVCVQVASQMVQEPWSAGMSPCGSMLACRSPGIA